MTKLSNKHRPFRRFLRKLKYLLSLLWLVLKVIKEFLEIIEQEPASSNESVGLPYAEIKIGIQI